MEVVNRATTKEELEMTIEVAEERIALKQKLNALIVEETKLESQYNDLLFAYTTFRESADRMQSKLKKAPWWMRMWDTLK